MIIRQCTIEDIEELKRDRIEPMCVFDNPDIQYAVAIEDNGLAACGGIQPLWEGVGNAWLMVKQDVKVKSLVETVIRYIFESNYRRVQCVVQRDFSKGRRFVRWLGFRREGVLKEYTREGKDVVLYAMVRE